jgi:hypothetical protein
MQDEAGAVDLNVVPSQSQLDRPGVVLLLSVHEVYIPG